MRWAPIVLMLAACSSNTPREPTSEPTTVGAWRDENSPPEVQPDAEVEPPPPAFSSDGEIDPMSLTPAFSASIQNPTDGWLVGGVPLPMEGVGFRFNPNKEARRRYGTVELVQALIRASSSVAKAHPGGTLTVNDIAMPGGREVGGHASHRNGRDVDVMFYLVDADGSPYPSKSIPIEPDGSGVDYRELGVAEDDVPVALDVPRTWAFVANLLADERAHVNRIFVVEHVRSLLLAHAESVDAGVLVRQRFEEVTCQPKFPHDDHFHIRFYCSADDIAAGCEDTFPIYPWHEAHLAAQGTTVRLAKKRPRPKPKLVSVAEATRRAKKKYGAFHPEVKAFLERRKAWVAKPHPGRTYCP